MRYEVREVTLIRSRSGWRPCASRWLRARDFQPSRVAPRWEAVSEREDAPAVLVRSTLTEWRRDDGATGPLGASDDETRI